jgi:5-methylcytosine-specific restriction endonuclease McrA
MLTKVAKRLKRRRQRLMAKTGGLCLYCGCELTANPRKKNQANYCTFDHFIPRAKLNGIELKDNKVAACRSCNERKGDMMPLDFLALLDGESPTQPVPANGN